ncbi:MAG: response regulator transcription factor [Thermincola sp.]|jgi:DNA-binding response OmpR family regulator|nr:response regulator transcription factor [Thermincola sp.]MDT3703774.1 response regulator transcription factor [Thermincola sp.]
MQAKILVVDDDHRILKAVHDSLVRAGFVVFTAVDGEEALKIFRTENPELVVLDIMLPKMDGIAVALEIRKQQNTPILFLSAKTEETDRIVAFKLGADDYVTKPFSPRELVLRVEAILRRLRKNITVPVNKERFEFQDLLIDIDKREVWRGGKQIVLTYKEFDLIWFLAQNPYRVLSRDKIYEYLWSHDPVISPASITVILGRLRSKIERDPANPQLLQTVWGVGYKFVPPDNNTR